MDIKHYGIAPEICLDFTIIPAPFMCYMEYRKRSFKERLRSHPFKGFEGVGMKAYDYIIRIENKVLICHPDMIDKVKYAIYTQTIK